MEHLGDDLTATTTGGDTNVAWLKDAEDACSTPPATYVLRWAWGPPLIRWTAGCGIHDALVCKLQVSYNHKAVGNQQLFTSSMNPS